MFFYLQLDNWMIKRSHQRESIPDGKSKDSIDFHYVVDQTHTCHRKKGHGFSQLYVINILYCQNGTSLYLIYLQDGPLTFPYSSS